MRWPDGALRSPDPPNVAVLRAFASRIEVSLQSSLLREGDPCWHALAPLDPTRRVGAAYQDA